MKRAGRQGRLEEVRERVRVRRGGIAVFAVVWLLGNTVAVFVVVLEVASLVLG